jgi:hypothetical protein
VQGKYAGISTFKKPLQNPATQQPNKITTERVMSEAIIHTNKPKYLDRFSKANLLN